MVLHCATCHTTLKYLFHHQSATIYDFIFVLVWYEWFNLFLHTDCIGSAFNTKGSMQCPNCRKVESGRWLFANGSAHAISEDDTLDWLQTDFPHDLSHSRRVSTSLILKSINKRCLWVLNLFQPFGFHWCPYNGFTLHSSNE